MTHLCFHNSAAAWPHVAHVLKCVFPVHLHVFRSSDSLVSSAVPASPNLTTQDSIFVSRTSEKWKALVFAVQISFNMANSTWTQYGHCQCDIALQQLKPTLIPANYECLKANVKSNLPQFLVFIFQCFVTSKCVTYEWMTNSVTPCWHGLTPISAPIRLPAVTSRPCRISCLFYFSVRMLLRPSIFVTNCE